MNKRIINAINPPQTEKNNCMMETMIPAISATNAVFNKFVSPPHSLTAKWSGKEERRKMIMVTIIVIMGKTIL